MFPTCQRCGGQLIPNAEGYYDPNPGLYCLQCGRPANPPTPFKMPDAGTAKPRRKKLILVTA